MLTLSPTYAELVRANEALQARLAEAERALATLQSREQPQAEHAPADSPLSRLAERLNLATRAAHIIPLPTSFLPHYNAVNETVA